MSHRLLSKIKESPNPKSQSGSKNNTSSNLNETEDDFKLQKLFGIIKLDKFKTLEEIAESDYF